MAVRLNRDHPKFPWYDPLEAPFLAAHDRRESARSDRLEGSRQAQKLTLSNTNIVICPDYSLAVN